MKPKIDQTAFGTITIEGAVFGHDVIILPTGEVKKRKKKLSKAIYGTSHILSLDEAKYVYKQGVERLIIGSGQYGNVRLSDEAADYFKRKHCQVDLEPTPTAIQTWNQARGTIVGLFHVTC
ncbi:MAG TPA: MTH938/NDUFAF3 family protein [Ktedonobacteraceae bacterium]|nr:MTH938/NDUFAF3 family protein [Ktedonobacteraceae bacterium]